MKVASNASPHPWKADAPIVDSSNHLVGYGVLDAHDDDTCVAVPPDGLDNLRGRANGLIVLASPELLWLVRRFVAGCRASPRSALSPELLHAWADAVSVLQSMEDRL